ncbi:LysR family transcriptional regulator [Streptomyces sp. NPDC092296]|uniref:LysR family transcriptional regulator n=1 Tax=Streptomyces sp. NPDC092296 TaxID=3366012 RepID=UPI003813A8D4
MDLALLRTFLTVHRAGSITRAAQLLGLSQPAVTGQIRALERQLGRPLFLRQPRGVAPTGVADELAHRVAPHLDALGEIAQEGLYGTAPRTLHLAGPPEFTASHLLPALAGLVADGLALRATPATGDDAVAGLASATYDVAVTTALPRGRPFHITPLHDEEHVLVAAPRWAGRLDPPAAVSPAALERLPLLDCGEELPFAGPYWATVFDTRPAAAAALVVPDLRAVLTAAREGAGIAVLPRQLCAADLAAGTLRVLLEPPMAPLRTFFLVVRAGTLAQPIVGRVHSRLLRAAARW